MYRIFCLMLLVTLLNACSSVSGTYVAIESGDSFMLPQTYTTSGKGALGTEYVYGLTQGKYIAVGKDDDGTYYRGPSHCIILLNNDLAVRYRQDGKVPGMREKWKQGLGYFYGVEGGIYVPFKPGAKPSYYYYQDASGITGEADSTIPPSPSGPATVEIAGAFEAQPRNNVATEQMAQQLAAQTTGSPNNVTANALGSAAGLAVGEGIGRAGLRNMQGNIILGPEVAEPRILESTRGIAPQVIK